MNIGMAAALAAAISATLACGDGGSRSGGPTTPSPTSSFPAGALSLTVSPIDQSTIRWITPLGNLNPPGHTLPTDHIYFYFANPNAGESAVARRTTVYAPGPGTVTWVLGGAAGQETKILVRQTATHSYYLDHLIPSFAITRDMALTAGQSLGTTGSAFAIDLGVLDDTRTVGFLNPARYTNSDALHADAALKYYAEPVRSQLYARVQRMGPDLDGTTNYDVAGRLSGNWFSTATAAPVSFAYDTWDPARVLISIGTGSVLGVFGIAAGDPAPRDVSVATGVVLYTITRTYNGPSPPTGGATSWMLVQMTDDTRMRLEMFASRPVDFTGNARTFSR
jgi:hypothetical protein